MSEHHPNNNDGDDMATVKHSHTTNVENWETLYVIYFIYASNHYNSVSFLSLFELFCGVIVVVPFLLHTHTHIHHILPFSSLHFVFCLVKN